MARRKNLPEMVKVKCHLSERLREVRTQLYGERGGSEMARRLGLPIRTWYNYEGGVTVPAEVLLRFVELTAVEPLWLLHGKGSKFRTPPAAHEETNPSATVESLLRTALQHLERTTHSETAGQFPATDLAEGVEGEELPNDGRRAASDWAAARADRRCLRIEGDAMVPIIADGAQVAFAEQEEDLESLEGKLVVAWVEGKPIVRWFRLSGQFGLLRAENPEFNPSILLLDMSGPADQRKLRRVLWISTPH
jgi:phage repressor protein C with HTH and peptisase S24 domain